MKNKKNTDLLYEHYQEKVAEFIFDEKVAGVFDDMIRRSVPGYAAVLGMVKVFTEQYALPASNCYDLGCSLGAAAMAMKQGMKAEKCRIIAVDNSPEMLRKCGEIIEKHGNASDIELCGADICDIDIKNASVVVLNYTLQFLDSKHRDDLIKKIYHGMLPGGVLILSEKIKFEDPDDQKFHTDTHHLFKRLHGYSKLEVSQKRKALENVLVPDTPETHRARLKKAGFARQYLWFQCFNFISIAAFRAK